MTGRSTAAIERLHADQLVVATGRVERPDLRRYVVGMVLLDVSALATDSAGAGGRVRGLPALGVCVCLGPKKRACYTHLNRRRGSAPEKILGIRRLETRKTLRN